MNFRRAAIGWTLALATLACGKSKSEALPPTVNGPGDGGTPVPTPTPEPTNSNCNGSIASKFDLPTTKLPATPALKVPDGFTIEVIASIAGPRHLAALPNGDLLVGTQSDAILIVPGAESDGLPGTPIAFAHMPDKQAHGVAFSPSNCTVYVGTTRGVFSLPYKDGQTAGENPARIGNVRPTVTAGHSTTSVAFTRGVLYATVGSSCNACVETDPTRATVQAFAPDGTNMTTRAKRIRNAIAIAVQPDTGTLWAGGAGQDSLAQGHPYELFDAITSHPGVADYGWPDCEENHVAYTKGSDCSNVVVPAVVAPAYSTILAASFYPTNVTGSYAFPESYRGGLFLSLHGSWHEVSGKYVAAPSVLFVPMNGDAPKTPVDWADPNKQHSEFVGGYQLADGQTRIGRAAGLAVGSRGSLFLADDGASLVLRIRPRK